MQSWGQPFYDTDQRAEVTSREVYALGPDVVGLLALLRSRRRKRGRRRVLTYDEFKARDHFTQQDLLAFAYGRLIKDPPEGFAARLPTPPMTCREPR